MNKKTNRSTILLLSIFWSISTQAQSIIDIGIGSSQQDDIAIQVNYGKQLTPKFTAGIQFQYGMPNYRFISGITFQDKGYSMAINAPLLLKINSENKLQLNLLLKPGMRVQGVKPEETNNTNGDYRSTAIVFEPGLLLNISINDKLNIQSGVTFPIIYEVVPMVLFENQTTLLHAGGNYTITNKLGIFLNGNMGSAWGSSGDSQKFLWSGQMGLRWDINSSGDKPINPIVVNYF
jgi:hypothetical protein